MYQIRLSAALKPIEKNLTYKEAINSAHLMSYEPKNHAILVNVWKDEYELKVSFLNGKRLKKARR